LEGEHYALAATYGIGPEWRDLIAGHRNIPGRGTLVGRVALEKRTLQIPDVFADPDFLNRETARVVGFRAIIGTPLLRDGEPIGFMSLHKETPGPFAAQHVQLFETFADQAVIAIENARLFEEVQARTKDLTEALEQQTATSHVLSIVSSSPGELDPVFETMLANVTRLCDAKFGVMWLCDQGGFRSVALHNAPPPLPTKRRRHPLVHPPQDTGLRRVADTKEVAQVADIRAIRPYIEREPFVVASVELGGYRTVVNVPMLKDDNLVWCDQHISPGGPAI
jgi:transcriptional regulator with GAF, ATPase, and Fis domain